MDMAPWLILGFVIAGLLHVFFPDGKINKLLGRSNLKSVIRAALIGIPLPLCSCGVIPTGVSIHKNGASKGAAISFLISTPQTGVDSIMVTYSMLGLPFAIVRPIVALITGILGGAITNKTEPEPEYKPIFKSKTRSESDRDNPNIFVRIFRYAFVDFMGDIAKWLVIGLLIAAFIAVLIPDDFFARYLGNDLLGMLIILIASIPLYVCATSSVPIAAVLLMKGISPGAALVFLMAGPATNAATISVIGNSMGRKTLYTYLATLIAGSLVFGLVVDHLLPRQWFTTAIAGMSDQHGHGLLPVWLQAVSAIAIAAFLLNIFVRKLIKRVRKQSITNQTSAIEMGQIKVFVRGMNCSHCKNNVETNLRNVEGIKEIEADVDSETVVITGENVDLDKVKQTVESIGYKYDGEVA